ncbi:MAG: phage capsid protein [Roseburia sp.]|nr:phage capsid protein [Roseburia sp.]
MGIIKWLKGVINNMFRTDAKKIFDVNICMTDRMESAIKEWRDITSGEPPWKDTGDDIDTINFAAFISKDIAKKVCLDIDISATGSRGKYTQSVVNELKKVLRNKVEDGCRLGGIMFKPNGSDNPANCIDYIKADNFFVTDKNSNGDITGCIFVDWYNENKRYYRRFEYHRFEGDIYRITNKAFVSSTRTSLGREIDLGLTKWDGIEPETGIENIKKPLYSYFRYPGNNIIEEESPLGVAVFAGALKELKDLDIAWSRKSGEVEDSKHMTFVPPEAIQFAERHKTNLPRFIKSLDMGSEPGSTIHEHTSTLLTDKRISDLNSILSLISTKCGFSQGQYTFDGKTSMMTATEVESSNTETIETIKEIRDTLRDAIDQLLYAVNVYADLYNLAPLGEYEVTYSFGDLTYSYEEDRSRHWQYVQQGKYPLWKYYVEFEGMSEVEAKQVVEEAKAENEKKDRNLFEEE